MNILKKIVVIVVASCAITTPLLAQNNLDSLQHLPEVVITEKYTDREIRSSAPMQVLSQKSIRNLNVLQLSDAVKHFSGVTVKDYGGIGGLKTVSVRSLGANHTAVNYNGFTINDVQTGQIDVGRFSLDNVDIISLNSGQSDNIFQPARLFASASVLNIQTIAPRFDDDQKINGRASLKVGSFGMFNPSVFTNLKLNEKLSASLSGGITAKPGKTAHRWRNAKIPMFKIFVWRERCSPISPVKAAETCALTIINRSAGCPEPLFFTTLPTFQNNACGTKHFSRKHTIATIFPTDGIFRRMPNIITVMCIILTLLS